MPRSEELELEFDGGVVAAAHARRAVGNLLGGADASLVADAILITSELVTNAVLHASGGIRLFGCFDHDGESLRIEVTDQSTDPPHLGQPLDGAIGGRGLRIVEALSSHWGWFRKGRGKTVWFEIDERTSSTPGLSSSAGIAGCHPAAAERNGQRRPPTH